MWCGIRAPAPLVKGGGWGSPLRLLDRALPNTGRASCVHTHAHTHSHGRTTCSHTRHAGAYNPVPKPYVWFTRAHMHTLIHTHACTCLLAQCDSCVRTYLFSGARVYLCAYICVHIQARVPTRTHKCVHPRAHTRARTHAHPRSAPASAGLGTVDKQRLVPIPCLLAQPCILHHTGLPHLDTQPACPSSSHAALWPPFRMGCPAGQGSSSQQDTLERGLHGSGRALGHASRGPGSWNWGQGLRA